MSGNEGRRAVRVLVVDDAAFMRRTLVKLLNRAGDVEIVGQARNGREAVELFESTCPDVVCLDIDMPAMDGTTALKHFMSRRPTPVIVVSSMTDRDDVPFELFRLGVVDFFPKPTSLTGAVEDQTRLLLHLVRNARAIRVGNLRRVPVSAPAVRTAPKEALRHLLVLAGSVGSIGGLLRLVSLLPPETRHGVGIACMVPLHGAITASFEKSVGSLFGWTTRRVGAEPVQLEAGTVCFLSSGRRATFGDGTCRIADETSSRTLDELFAEAGRAHRTNSTMVLLGGSDPEGLEGLAEAHAAGARCYLQDPATALFDTWKPMAPVGVERLSLESIVARITGAEASPEEEGRP